jgi:hypothetical protein
MSPKEVYNQLRNLKTGSLNNVVSSDDEYAKVTLYVSLLVHSNIQYSKVYLGDKLLGTINKYRYIKMSEESEIDKLEDATSESISLFSSMISTYLSKTRITDNMLKTIIIFLVDNKKITEFRNVRKLVDSQYGITMCEYLDNLSISSNLLVEPFLQNFNTYPIHKEIIKSRLFELVYTNNCRERYVVLMKPAWESGELSPSDPIELDFIEKVLEFRSKIRDLNLNVQVSDLCDLLNIPYGTYGNNKRKFVSNLSTYFSNSVYSSLIDLIHSLK